MNHCRWCEKEIPDTFGEHKRPRLYCGNKCRAMWQHHIERKGLNEKQKKPVTLPKPIAMPKYDAWTIAVNNVFDLLTGKNYTERPGAVKPPVECPCCHIKFVPVAGQTYCSRTCARAARYQREKQQCKAA